MPNFLCLQSAIEWPIRCHYVGVLKLEMSFEVDGVPTSCELSGILH